MTLKNADTEYSPRISPRNWLLPVLNNQTTPPTTPNDGDRYRVTATATGLWAGKENNIAIWNKDDRVWVFQPLVEPQIWYDMTSQNWHYMSNSGVITQFDKIPLAISDVTGLQAALDGKAPLVHKANHVHGGTDAFAVGDVLDATARIQAAKNGAGITAPEPVINFKEGTNITMSVADNVGTGEIDVTINSVGSGGHALLDGGVDTDTVSASPAQGSLIIGDATSKWNVLAIGSNGQIPISNGTSLFYRILAAADIPNIAESQVTNLVSDLSGKQATSAKNAASGYAGLDASTLLSLSQMPSGVGHRVASGAMGADAANFTISSLATGKHHYILYIFGKTDGTGGYLGMRFNADSGANYDTTQIVGGSGTSTGLTINYFTAGSIGTSDFFLKIEIINNNVFDNNVLTMSEIYTSGHSAYKFAGVYFAAADITSITILSTNGSSVPAGNLKQNTSYILYEVA